MSEQVRIRCMGGHHCTHRPGQCTADPEYQREIAQHRLDEQRAAEANRIWSESSDGPDVATIAARLAREDWRPPDPVEVAVQEILRRHYCEGGLLPEFAIRAAVLAGLELGKAQR